MDILGNMADNEKESGSPARIYHVTSRPSARKARGSYSRNVIKSELLINKKYVKIREVNVNVKCSNVFLKQAISRSMKSIMNRCNIVDPIAILF